MAKVFVITGPSGVGKGTLIRELLQRVPGLELSVSATTRQPREGEVDGRDYHFLSAEEFERRVERRGLPRVRHLQRQPLRDAALARSSGGWRRGTRCVLEIEVQGAQQVRAAKPDSVQIFIAPPDPAVLRERLRGRGTDSAEAIDARLEVAKQELAAQGDFDHRVVNDDLGRAAAELEAIVRAELGLSLDSRAE